MRIFYELIAIKEIFNLIRLVPFFNNQMPKQMQMPTIILMIPVDLVQVHQAVRK